MSDSSVGPAEKTVSLLCPVRGRAHSLDDVSDPVFSGRMMGEGLAIDPDLTCREAVAPCRGVVFAVASHAVGMTSPDGVEVLLHVGLDTFSLGDDALSAMVNEGDEVVSGQPLVAFDPSAIRGAGLDPTVLLIVTNTAELGAVDPVSGGVVREGDPAIGVRLPFASASRQPVGTGLQIVRRESDGTRPRRDRD